MRDLFPDQFWRKMPRRTHNAPEKKSLPGHKLMKDSDSFATWKRTWALETEDIICVRLGESEGV